jgi:hypothetical protein
LVDEFVIKECTCVVGGNTGGEYVNGDNGKSASNWMVIQFVLLDYGWRKTQWKKARKQQV